MARAQRLAGEINIKPVQKPLNLDILDQKGYSSGRAIRLDNNGDMKTGSAQNSLHRRFAGSISAGQKNFRINLHPGKKSTLALPTRPIII